MAGALDGMRVVDLSQYEAGPSCGQYLGWLGADVVKVESIDGEPGRKLFAADPDQDSQYFLNFNANKRSLAVDLKKPEGRDVFLRLVDGADVLLENQGPGVMERLGLGHDELLARNPRLVYARIKGYGLSGPYAEYKSFDQLAQAASGVMSLTGEVDGPPMRPGATVGDTGTGVHAALAIVSAYVQQQRTGRGQLVELAMHEVMTMFVRTTTAQHWGPDAPPAPRASRSDAPPAGLYATKGGGPNDYVYLVLANRAMWQQLCTTIGRPDILTDPRFATGRARAENAEALHAEIGRWFLEHPKTEAMRILGEAGLPCSATFASNEVFADPHLRARGFVHELDDPVRGDVMLLGNPLRLGDNDVPMRLPPRLGEHTDEILRDDLGLDEATVQRLRETGAVG